ncbi:MAG: MarP family serine protease [Patescibacteria group bacterium]|nr:MarP family serine protease [Patescibacteria group bacterium]
MLLDAIIVLFLISAFFRGREIGFIRQACSSIGFFGGLFIGSQLQPFTIRLGHTMPSRALIAIATSIGSAVILLIIGEYCGVALKRKTQVSAINIFDNTFGAGLSIVSFLLTVWIGASLLSGLPVPGVQQLISNSRILASLNRTLPPAPDIIASLSHLVDPNGFPDVFIGGEPSRRPGSAVIPQLGQLETAVSKDKASVVKIEGQGCGGIVEGSGFVVGNGLIATNAHVVAGIKKPYVQDANGTHTASIIWFNPNLDFAVLRASNLAGPSLNFAPDTAKTDTPAAVLGYPGGGSFLAEPAVVSDSFIARGRNIYGRGVTSREVYELRADIIPGNSGGPVVATDGSVIGVVFAQSTAYEHVGYALTSKQVLTDYRHAITQNKTVSSGSCAE